MGGLRVRVEDESLLQIKRAYEKAIELMNRQF